MKKLIITVLLAFISLGHAQENISYQKPSKEILQLADYQRPPSVMMDSKKEVMVLSYRPTYKTLAELAKEDLKLAGLRIDPVTNISSSMVYSDRIQLQKVGDQTAKDLTGLPANPQIAYLSFSPDEKYLSFTHTTDRGVELWIVNIATLSAKKITADNLNGNLGRPYSWSRDSKSLLVQTLPQNRKSILSAEKTLPKGPTTTNTTGKVSQNRTYQDMLKSPLDETNFETLATSEIHRVDLNGNETNFLPAALFSDVSFSPDGQYVMVSEIKRPFSYIVPYNRFPTTTTVYDTNGKVIKVVNEVPLNEIIPQGFSSVRNGKRSMNWRADQPATLSYVEALDGGDQAKPADFRDQIFVWEAPFQKSPEPLFKTKYRYAGIQWGDDRNAFVNERWYDTRTVQTYWVNPKTKDSKMIINRNYQDIYSDPGNLQTKKNQFDRYVVDIADGKVFWIGDGFSRNGQFPFIDEMDLKTFKNKRVYTSKSKNIREDIMDILDLKKGEVLIAEQSATAFPNYFKKNIRTGRQTALTNFTNPFKGLDGVYKEVISYKRNDGVELSGTLYLPAGYDRKNKTEKLPLLIWAYPREYTSKATAGMSTQNPNTFTYPSYGSFVYWVTKGYAVLQDAAFPIVGLDGAEPNDTFVPQLVADAQAAIDAVDQLGYIDRKKVAVGGHSYGAFMTANLLTHSDLFACGIARSGAYNRTLTPFGFQSEQRNYWDNPNLYNTMSPFMHANEMNHPILLVHGEADNNMGTFRVQTERYFDALKNLGKDARMVLLPFEAHGYQAKENILHLLYEQDVFLEKCLKNNTKM